MRSDKRKHLTRRGASLLEVMACTVCASLFLIPTATMLGDAAKWSGRMEQQSELLSLAENRLAETEFQLATQFRSSQVSDHFGTLGFPNARYTVTSSDDPSVGGIRNRLMMVHVLVWQDDNRDVTWNPGEPRHELHTAMARRN